MVGFKQLEASLKNQSSKKYASQEELRREVERLRIEVEIASKIEYIDENDAQVTAQPPMDAVIKGFNTPDDFVVKKGSLEYTDGSHYEGDLLGNIRHGKGIYTRADGAIYDGDWQYDVLDGTATAITPQGQKYIGSWKAGKAHGQGTVTYENGSIYQGDFQNDARHGWGSQSFPSTNEHYEGEWHHDRIHGQGRWTHADGSFFEGEWKDGHRIHGKYMSADGNEEYHGAWLNDMRHGCGVQYRRGVWTYDGEWKKDQQHGNGKCVYADGSVYEGEWCDGQRCGQGTLFLMTTTRGNDMLYSYKGEWKDDAPHGKGTYLYDTGDKYAGDFLHGKRHGFGRCLYNDSTKYEGEWKNDLRYGQGTCIYANGDVYNGQWEKDLRHGYGVCRFADGVRFHGQWDCDAWVQTGCDPGKSKVAGPGVYRAVAGREAVCMIEARDGDGNRRLNGGDLMNVWIVDCSGSDEIDSDSSSDSNFSGDSSGGDMRDQQKFCDNDNDDDNNININAKRRVEAAVIDNNDGTYQATYIIEHSGVYSVSITCCGEHVADSPYLINVHPGPVCPRRITVRGTGSDHTVAVVNEYNEFEVMLFDEYGNPCDLSSIGSSISSGYGNNNNTIKNTTTTTTTAPTTSTNTTNTTNTLVPMIKCYLKGNGIDEQRIDVVASQVKKKGRILYGYTAPSQPGYYRLHIEYNGVDAPGTPYSLRVIDTYHMDSNSSDNDNNPLLETDIIDASDDDDCLINHNNTSSNTNNQKAVVDTMTLWEKIAAEAYAADGVMDGWDSDDATASKKKGRNNDEDAYLEAHPSVPVVENLEDLWLVSKLQKERKEKEEREKRKKLEDMRSRFEGTYGPAVMVPVEEVEAELKEIVLSASAGSEMETEVEVVIVDDGGSDGSNTIGSTVNDVLIEVDDTKKKSYGNRLDSLS